MAHDNGIDLVLGKAITGDASALAEVFEHYRDRLEHVVRLRLDPRLHGRLDPADVLQESYLELSRRFTDYVNHPALPFYLWLRRLTLQKLVDVHRRHLGAKMRDAGLEVALSQFEPPRASSESLAERLLGQITSASRAAIRTETQHRVQEALNTMDAIDREVLVLRHFEDLSNGETACLLGIQEAAASKRYLRALKRLKEILSALPENLGEVGA